MRSYVVIIHGISGPGPGRLSGVPYSRGDVLTVPDEGVSEDIDRAMIRLQFEVDPPAIRPATPTEAQQTKVSVEGTVAKNLSLESIAEEQRVTIATLQSELEKARQKIAELQNLEQRPVIDAAEAADKARSEAIQQSASQALLETTGQPPTGTMSVTQPKPTGEIDSVEAARALAQEERVRELMAEPIPKDMPSSKALTDFGYKTIAEVDAVSEAALTDVPGIGVNFAAKIKEYIAKLKTPIDEAAKSPIAPSAT